MRTVIAKLLLAPTVSFLLLQATLATLAAPAQTAPKDLTAKEELAVGQLYFSTNDFPQAIEHLDKAIKKDRENGQLFYARGHAYYMLDRYIQAIPDYTLSLQLKYDPALNYERRAYCYLNSRQYQKGIADCTEAIKSDPQSRIAYFNRAKAYRLIGEKEKSKQDSDKVKELDKNPRAKDLCDRAKASHDNGEKIKLYTAALKLDPKYPSAVLLLGSTYLELDKKKEALDCFNRLMLLEPGNLSAYIDRGLCRLAFGQLADAIKDLSNVLALAPECYEAYSWRGEARVGGKDAKGGLADLKKAMDIMKARMATDYARTNQKYRNTLGRFLVSTYAASARGYEQQGDLAKAIEEMTCAVNESRLAPVSLSQLLFERAELFKKAGKIDEEHKDLQSAKAVSDKLDAARRASYIRTPGLQLGGQGKSQPGAAKNQELPPD